jgi:hypothetical protein
LDIDSRFRDSRLRVAGACRWGVTVVVATALALSASVAHADEIIERVMAVVAGDLIMMSDVRAARELRLVDPGKAADPDREVLTRLIDRALVLAEADRYQPPEPTAAAVDAQLAAVRARFPSADVWNATLVRLGLDENHLRRELREDLRVRAYLDQRFATDDVQQRDMAVATWIAGLRRRADIVDGYAPIGR